MGGTVILACRSVEKGELAKERIQRITKCNKGSVIVMHLDLSVLSSVRKFAENFRAMRIPLHVMINNAGIMLSNRHVTEDGFEKVFSVNYLSHFLLTNVLLPELEKSNGRVVNVASTMHKLIRAFDFNNIMAEKGFSLFGTYGQSKLAMILFSSQLQKRWQIICILFCVALYRSQYSSVQYCAVLFCTVCCTELYCTVLCAVLN